MMYYLLTERPLQSFLGVVIMISGLVIYAVFRKRAGRGAASPGSRIAMLQPVKIAALAAVMLLAAALPARAADTVTADDTARFLAGMAPSADSPLTPLTKEPGLAAARQILR